LFRKSNIGIVRKAETSRATMVRMKHQELLKGLIRLHILHHAAKDEFYGQWMIHGARPSWLHAKPGDALPDAPPARAPRIYEVARGTAGPHLPARLPRHGIGQGGKQARRDPGPRAYRRAEADAPALMSRNARSSPPADASGWLHTSTGSPFSSILRTERERSD